MCVGLGGVQGGDDRSEGSHFLLSTTGTLYGQWNNLCDRKFPDSENLTKTFFSDYGMAHIIVQEYFYLDSCVAKK